MQIIYKTIWQGDAYEIGAYKDEWGVVWKNVERGHWGEVKEPIVRRMFEAWGVVQRRHSK